MFGLEVVCSFLLGLAMMGATFVAPASDSWLQQWSSQGS